MDSVVHFEMPAEDKKRMRTFYETAFGWKTTQLGPEMSDYVTVATGETDENRMLKKPGMINGGFFQKGPGNDRTVITIAVTDINASIEKIKAAGGTVSSEPVMIPGIGMYAAVNDTEGNRVSILQPLNM